MTIELFGYPVVIDPSMDSGDLVLTNGEQVIRVHVRFDRSRRAFRFTAGDTAALREARKRAWATRYRRRYARGRR